MATSFKQRAKTLVAKWASRFGLADYTFCLETKERQHLTCDYARVFTDEELREVCIELNQALLEQEPHELEQTIIHELLHARLNEYTRIAEDVIREYVDRANTRRVLRRLLSTLEHKVVVALTEAFTRGTHGTSPTD
jgi:hypothetical protein